MINKHLEPVFSLLLPELEKSDIQYWVLGGIGVAACVGKFVRENKDVDIFVKEEFFEKTKAVLSELCKDIDMKVESHGDQFSRCKLEIKKNRKEILSVIPIFLEKNVIRFEYPGGDEIYSRKDLKPIERNISEYRFFTPTKGFIVQKFFRHLAARPDKLNRDCVQEDISAILRWGATLKAGELES